MNEENELLEPVEDENDTTIATEEERTSGILKLSKPFDVNGEKINQIEFDLDLVKPIQYINLIARLSKKEEISVPELNINVQIGYFSLACGIPVSDLKRMPSTKDFSVACSKVRSFLLGASDTESTEE
ncbi:MAG: hypothetical protein K0R46_3345 [Herbinix sp.]|jgi:hypothetical protein|nr:hypothetical protein [Herbinix sp.]